LFHYGAVVVFGLRVEWGVAALIVFELLNLWELLHPR